jgi:glycosyltransferase involved in cell wall biosynthesis
VTGPKPRLLFLCQTVPYPPDGGVWIRTYHVLRLLARVFDITALCFERAPVAGNDAARDLAATRAALSRFGSVEIFPIPQRHSRSRYLWDHARSTMAGRVYTAYLYQSTGFERRLREIVAGQAIDLIHMDSMDLAGYLPRCAGVPVACVHHDVTSQQLRRRAEIERRSWRRAYVVHQARLTEQSERTWCRRVALNVAVSAQDAASLQRIAPGARVAVVPNGVDIDEFQPGRDAGCGVAFVGGLHWFPNADALDHFAADILPHLRAVRPDLPVQWIGSATVEQQQDYHRQFGVDVTGHVADVRPFMRDAACHIVPLRAGGGTRLKILNSWAMGKPVVTTSIGCEGLDAVDGTNILIRDDPKDFATATLAVLGDRALARRLGEAGRATAERTYSWDVIGRGMTDRYLALANGACPNLPLEEQTS